MPYPISTHARTMTTPRNLREKWTRARSIMEVRGSKFEVRNKFEFRNSLRVPFQFFGKQLLRACSDDFCFRLQALFNKPGVLQRRFQIRFRSLERLITGLDIDPGCAVKPHDGVARHGDSGLLLAGYID